MNTHKLREIQTMGRSALVVTGLLAASGLLTTAHARDIEFAQKFIGVPNGLAQSMQFRSTIIDPARSGKSPKIESRQLRVIPIENNAAGTSANANSCSICGVVESISLTVRDGEPDKESAMENVEKSGKNRGNLLLTEERWLVAPVTSNGLKKHAPLFEVKVRMSDGTVRIVNQPTQPEYAVGDYVRVVTGAVVAA
jgi:hypothetical protein